MAQSPILRPQSHRAEEAEGTANIEDSSPRGRRTLQKHAPAFPGDSASTSDERATYFDVFRLFLLFSFFLSFFLFSFFFSFFAQPGAANEILRYRRFIMEKCKYRQTG
jgi:hypothetical protein